MRTEGRLRSYLGLDGKNRQHGLPALNVPTNDPGRPGTTGVAFPELALAESTSIAPYYCTIGALVAPTARVP